MIDDPLPFDAAPYLDSDEALASVLTPAGASASAPPRQYSSAVALPWNTR